MSTLLEERPVTVFDPIRLHLLVDDVASRPFVLDLARTYQRMLPTRVSRVTDALVGPEVDLADALDAVLSLKVSSAMTGVSEIAEMARTIEVALRARDLPAARVEASMLARAAGHADHALTAYLTTEQTAQASRDSIR